MTGLKYYLNIDGLNGGSTAIGHVGWFEIDGYDFNIDNPLIISGGGTGKIKFSPVKINLSGASNPELLRYIATGRTIKAIQLDGVTVGSSEQTVYSLNLGAVSINNYGDASTTTGDKLTFDYKQVAVTTRSQKADGSLDTPQSYAFDVSQLINVATTSVPTPATPPISSSGSVSPSKYYLNIDGLNGGSTAIGHVGWFEIDGYNFNIDNPSIVSGGGGTDKLTFSPVKINLNGASNPELLRYIATGRTIKAIQLDGVTVGSSEQTVYSLNLGAVSINNYGDASTTTGDKLTFDYKQVAVTTRSQKADGSLDTPQSYAFDVSQLINVATTSVPTPATPPSSSSGSVSPSKYYLNIDGLNGGSTAIGHVGWFEIDGYNFNIDNPSIVSGGGGTDKLTFSPVKINLNGASNPELLRYIATGRTIKAIQLDGVTVGSSEQTVYSLNLGAVSINNYGDASTTTGDKLTFDYKQVAVTTRSQKADGSLDTPQSYAFDVSQLINVATTSVPTPATPPSSSSGSVSPSKYYLNIDGLNGGSTAIGHVGWFEIDGYNFNIDNPSIVSGGGGTDKLTFSPVKINLNGASNPELLRYIATGRTIKAIQLDGVTVGSSEQTVYSLNLGAVSINNYGDASTTTGDKLIFDYKQVAVTTRSQKADGSLDTPQSYAFDVSQLINVATTSVPTPATPPSSSSGSVSPSKYYLNIDGLNGGSTAIGHVGWFEIDGYNFNIDNPSIVSGGGGTDKLTFSPVKINLNGASNPELLRYIATGRTIKAIQLDGVTVGSSEQTVYSLNLGAVSINNYGDSSTTTGDKLTFDYKQVAVTTRSQKADGSLDTPQSYAFDVSQLINVATTSVPTPATPPSSSSGSVSPSKYYLNIDGLNGGSTAIGHVGWFEIDGYNFNIDNPLIISGGGTGKITFSPVKINLSGASNPELLRYIATGRTIKAIQLDGVTVGSSEQTVYSLNLGAVSINNYGDASTTTGDKLTFDYKQVAVTTRSQKADGSLDTPQSYAFDVSANSEISLSTVPTPSTSSVTNNTSLINQAPAGTDKSISLNEDSTRALTVSDFGFTDPLDTPVNALSAVKISSLASTGSLKLNGVAVAVGDLVTVADLSAGKLIFTPVANASGATNFTFQVQDNGGTANGGIDLDASANTITFNVAPVNDAPAGTDKSILLNEDSTYALTVADFGFTDPLDTPANALSAVKISSLASTGTLKLNGAAVAAGDLVTVADITGGKLTFTSAPNTSGAANFTFQVKDDGGIANGGVDLDPTANIITFNIAPINDAPAGTDKSISLVEDNTYALTAADFGFTDLNDTPANAFSAVKISSLVAAGSLKLNGAAVTVGDLVAVADITAGKLTFSPVANANGNNYASFTFQVKDDGGVANGGIDLDATPNTITFNVTPANDAPVITIGVTDKATGSVTEIADGALGENARNLNVNGTLTISDVDFADVQTVAAIPKGTPYAGTFTPIITDSTTGDGTGQITWSFSVPDKDLDSLAAGQVLTQTYTIVANDGQGGIANQDVTITLNGSNDAPTVVKPIKKETIGEGQALKFIIPADTFQDVDAGDKLTYSATLKDGKPLPTWLVLNPLTGEFSGTPTGTSAGEYKIKVIATDIAGTTANTILTLKVLDFIGGKGNDTLHGTDYAETLAGGDGDDTLIGKAGDDCLEGGKGNDHLTGGDGHDKLSGGAGNDKLFGEADDDHLDGGEGDDHLEGGKGHDKLIGGKGKDKLIGGDGHDYLEAGAGDDTLVGGKGDDTLLGNAGSDYLEGSEGDDTYVFDISTAQGKDKIEEAVKGGYDQIVFEGTGNVKIDLSITTAQNINANLVLTVINLEDVTGSSGNDTISGNSSNNILAGAAGNDTLKGGKGADAFVFGSSYLSFAAIGVDKIVDFAPMLDEIRLDKATFAHLGTLAGSHLLASDFEIVKQDSAVAASVAAIVYSSSSGKLFYNENGISDGLGLGGQFAELTKNLNLTSDEFMAIS